MTTINRLYIIDTRDLEPAERFEYRYNKMPADRKEKIDSVKPARSKRLSLGAGVLLDTAMHRLNIDDYVIGTGKHGKPYLTDHPDIFFNLSHSGDYAALVVSDKETGVDIQEIKHFRESLINHVFSDEEKRTVQMLCEKGHDPDTVYTRMWTMKEAVMKHSGIGLSLDPRNISLRYIDDLFIPVCPEYETEGLSLTEYELNGYALSVCSGYDFALTVPSPEQIIP